MKTLFGIFLILIALFTGGCSVLSLLAGAGQSGLGWIAALGLLIAILASLGARALFAPAPTQPPMPPDPRPENTDRENIRPPDPDEWK